jgi:hypothetical protein
MAGPFICLTVKTTGKKVILNFGLIEGFIDEGKEGTRIVGIIPTTSEGDDNSWLVAEPFARVEELLEAACEEEKSSG